LSLLARSRAFARQRCRAAASSEVQSGMRRIGQRDPSEVDTQHIGAGR